MPPKLFRSPRIRKNVVRKFLKTVLPGLTSQDYIYDGSSLLTYKKLDNFLPKDGSAEGGIFDRPAEVEYRMGSREFKIIVSLRVPNVLHVNNILNSFREDPYHKDLQLLEVTLQRIFQKGMNYSRWPRIGKKFIVDELPNDGRCSNTREEISIHRAFIPIVSLVANGIIVTHEVKCHVRPKKSMYDVLQDGKAKIEGMEFCPMYQQNRLMTCDKVAKMSLSDRLAEDNDKTFREYYKLKFTRRIEHEDKTGQVLFEQCLRILDGIGDSPIPMLVLNGRGEDGPQFFIPHLCYPTEISNLARRDLPQLCGWKPAERMEFTSRLDKHLSQSRGRSNRDKERESNGEKDRPSPSPKEFLRTWGLVYDNFPLPVNYLTMPEPKMRISGSGDLIAVDALRLSMQKATLESPSDALLLEVHYLTQDFRDRRFHQLTDDMAGMLDHDIQKWGVTIARRNGPKVVRDIDQELATIIKTYESSNPPRNARLVIVCWVADGHDGQDMYLFGKAVSLGRNQGRTVVTQFFNTDTQTKIQRKPGNQLAMVTSCVAAQIMAKLGFPVWYNQPPVGGPDSRKNMLVLGVDVYHRGRTASFAGFSALWYSRGKVFLWGGMAKLPPKSDYIKACEGSNDDGVEHLNDFVLRVLYSRYLAVCDAEGLNPDDKNNFKKDSVCELSIPNDIVVFREGSGCGQNRRVQANEVKQVRDAVANVVDTKICKPELKNKLSLTFVITTKRVNQSLATIATNLQQDMRQAYEGGRSMLDIRMDQQNVGNAPYGAVVNDPSIIKDPRREFYLVSMNSSPSTVRAVHHNVIALCESIAQPGTQLWPIQPDKHIAELAFELSHDYYVWAGPITVPSPVQYATKAAELASRIDASVPGSCDNSFHDGWLAL